MSTMNITLPGLYWPYRAYAGELSELARVRADLHPAAQDEHSS